MTNEQRLTHLEFVVAMVMAKRFQDFWPRVRTYQDGGAYYVTSELITEEGATQRIAGAKAFLKVSLAFRMEELSHAYQALQIAERIARHTRDLIIKKVRSDAWN